MDPPEGDSLEEEGRFSDEDDDDDDEDWHRRENLKRIGDLKKSLEKVQEALKSPALEQDEAGQHRFLELYGNYLSPHEDSIRDKIDMDTRNVLYALARSKPDAPSHSWLVKHLVKRHPDLLREMDYTEDGALVVAIKRGKVDFIRAVLESGIEESKLQSILLPLGTSKDNCIHLAINKDIDQQITVKLIEKASEDILAAQNSKKYTPLHLAVDYRRCSWPQLDVLKALLKHGDTALDPRTGKPDFFSPYRYHFETQRIHIKKLEDEKNNQIAKVRKAKIPKKEVGARISKWKEAKEKKEVDLARKGLEEMEKHPRGDKREGLESRRDLAKLEIKEQKPRPEQRKDLSTPLGGELQLSMTSLGRVPTVNVASENLSPTVRAFASERYQANETRAQAPQDTRAIPHQVRPRAEEASAGDIPKPRRNRVPKPEALDEATRKAVADQVADELKLHYFRTILRPEPDDFDSTRGVTSKREQSLPGAKFRRTHQTAERFLFGDNIENQKISFKLPPDEPKDLRKIRPRDFENSYERFKFDKTLLYVHLGQVVFDDGPKRLETHGVGRTDLKRFFEWLYDKKEVRNILKVIVEERKDPAHSDESIEVALQRFSIEILDWRKKDICPLAVRQACKGSRLRELHLWWSGNNAILRAWSEPEGLVQMEQLGHLYIHRPQHGLESRSRTGDNLEAFQKRLRREREARGWNHIRVHDCQLDELGHTKLKGKNAIGRVEAKSHVDTHRWLTTMDTFAHGIYDLDPLKDLPQMDPTDSSASSKLPKDVSVVLIDDGVNIMHRAIGNKIEDGISFESGLEHPDQSGRFGWSTDGHGTFMAYMIGRVCPRVKIFVCKLDVSPGGIGEKPNFTAKSAADAVDFAVSRGFDIISMSWTIFNDPKHHNADLARLETALDGAFRKNILVFCSAPDIGALGSADLSRYCPFGCSSLSGKIFKIGAAKADGTMYPWAGDSGSVNFILPGHNVEYREDDKTNEVDENIPKTGSSVATALAAGLAALIIHCVRLGAIYNHHSTASGKGNDTNAVTEDSITTIKTFEGMRKVLNSMISGHSKENRRLDVQQIFKEPGELINDDRLSKEAKWKEISKLARDLDTKARG